MPDGAPGKSGASLAVPRGATRPSSASMNREATITRRAISCRSRRLIGDGAPTADGEPRLRDGLDEHARSRGVVRRIGPAARALDEGGEPLQRRDVAVDLGEPVKASSASANQAGRTARSDARSAHGRLPVGVPACRIPAAAASTVSSRSFASDSSSATSSTPAPGMLRTPLQAASTDPGSSGSSTTSSSMATPASRSSTSRPTTLPRTAPISAATAPRTPGSSR